MPELFDDPRGRDRRAKHPRLLLALAAAGVAIALTATLASGDETTIPSPPNDDFSKSQIIASVPFETAIDNTGATTEASEPEGCGNIGHTVWYSFTPAETMLVEFGASGILPSVAVYTGGTLATLELVDCDDRKNHGPTPPPFFRETSSPEDDAFFDLEVEMQGGVAYRIQVGGWDAEAGTLEFSIDPITQITGFVFEDLDSNGMRDESEPGVNLPVTLSRPDGEHLSTSIYGNFRFDVEPGDYMLSITPKLEVSGFCVDSFGGFYPLRLDDCLIAEAPAEATTATEVSVTIDYPGDNAHVEFGIHRIEDADILAGVAVLEDGRAPPGTLIEAFVDDTKCGESLALNAPAGIHNYELIIYGATERVGCPTPGDEVQITVGRIPAATNFPYEYAPAGSGLTGRNLVAIEDYSWFWAEEYALPDAQSPPSPVVAFIDGNVCGQATAVGGSHVFRKVVGFSKLAVPSAELQAGCGHAGATVRFSVGGVMTNASAPWEPGIHELDVNLPGAVGSGDTNCSGDIEALDAMLVLLLAAGEQVDSDCVYVAADVNCDGLRDSLDALIILKHVAALPYELPAGCPPVNQSGP